MAKEEKEQYTRLITPEFRVSYPHVFKAAQVMGKGEPKFSITMLFKKTEDLSALKLAIKHAKLAKWPNKNDWPSTLMSPVVDGDGPAGIDKKTGKRKDGYAGCWVVKATSNAENRPGVVDENVEVITEASQFYPGCYARAQVFARVWEFMGKEGVHFILDHVQKTRDGKSFGGKKSAQEVFGAVAGSADNEEEDTVEAEEADDGF